MCGSLKLEGMDRFTRINSYIKNTYLVEDPIGNDHYFWSGHCRIDGRVDGKKSMFEQWEPEIWVPSIIKIEAFTERSRTGGTIVTMPARRLGVILSAEGHMKVLTRPSKTGFEKSIHNRMPVRLPAGMRRDEFLHQLNNAIGASYQ